MEGSHLAAEQRMRQLELKIQRLTPEEYAQLRPDAHAQLSASMHKNYQEPDFKSLAALMENQMYAQALFSQDEEKDTALMNPMLSQDMGVMASMGSNLPLEMQGMMSQLSSSAGTSKQGAMQSLMMALIQQKVYAALKSRSENQLTNRIEEAYFPVAGQVSSHYGERLDPISGEKDFHKGIDVAAPMGAPIKAPWQGKVVYVGEVPGFGKNTVVMAHPNTMQEDGKILYSIFGHNSEVSVQVGDTVAKGAEFAKVGNDGHSTGPHLHWETRLAQPGLLGTEIFKDKLSMTYNPLKFA